MNRFMHKSLLLPTNIWLLPDTAILFQFRERGIQKSWTWTNSHLLQLLYHSYMSLPGNLSQWSCKCHPFSILSLSASACSSFCKLDEGRRKERSTTRSRTIPILREASKQIIPFTQKSLLCPTSKYIPVTKIDTGRVSEGILFLSQCLLTPADARLAHTNNIFTNIIPSLTINRQLDTKIVAFTIEEIHTCHKNPIVICLFIEIFLDARRVSNGVHFLSQRCLAPRLGARRRPTQRDTPGAAGRRTSRHTSAARVGHRVRVRRVFEVWSRSRETHRGRARWGHRNGKVVLIEGNRALTRRSVWSV